MNGSNIMSQYSLTYDQKDLMIIPHSGMFNFTPPIFAGNVVNGGMRDKCNAISGAHA